MAKSSTDLREIVCEGGMTCLKEFPEQGDKPLKDKYFDEFTTYAPMKWLGSRRLTLKELELFDTDGVIF